MSMERETHTHTYTLTPKARTIKRQRITLARHRHRHQLTTARRPDPRVTTTEGIKRSTHERSNTSNLLP